MVSNDRMRKDSGFPAFIEACIANENVHRYAALAWIEGLERGHGSAMVHLSDVHTYDPSDCKRVAA